uniref:Uncharacterized protein n=1 Tax=Setaria italica TaxID=4555 RepID=K4A4C4_SETIT
MPKILNTRAAKPTQSAARSPSGASEPFGSGEEPEEEPTGFTPSILRTNQRRAHLKFQNHLRP